MVTFRFQKVCRVFQSLRLSLFILSTLILLRSLFMDDEIRQLLLLLEQARSTPIEIVVQKTHVRLMVFHQRGLDFRLADLDPDLVAMFN